MRHTFRLVAFVAFLSAALLHGAALAQAPQWIWSSEHDGDDRARDSMAVVRLERTFEVTGAASSAVMKLAADFCRASVELNGRVVLIVEPYSPTVEHDVTSHLKSGANRLTIVCDRCCGPSAVALSLTITAGDGKQTAIVSDAHWRADSAAAVELGAVEPELWGIGRRSTAVNPFENYEQWRTALGTGKDAAADQPSFFTAPGFEILLVRKARPEEGSWISIAFDPKGRLTVSREDKGLLRMTLDSRRHVATQVETIDSELQECRGLLYAYDSLYANANNSIGLYRLRDTDGDDRFDEVKRLREFPGGVGHGRNDLALGADGMIYSIHGDSVDLPTVDIDRTSPLREARRGRKSTEGCLVRTDRDGRQWELVCSGLRNPYGVAVSSSGELFTYDADAEFDMGTPWYRPTRIVQLLSGADYGWRGVTGKWPPYYVDRPDNALPTLDIGRGSPTAAIFGSGTSFPAPYKQALYVLDWSYGRMLAVHLAPRGSGHRANAETFLQGRPMNLTDVAVGPDGAMYVVTGGRKTQSAIYRVAYVGQPVQESMLGVHELSCKTHAATARAMRQRLEAYHGRVDAAALDAAWPHLDDADPAIRQAARMAIEHQPLATWRQRALDERRTTASLAALMSLAAGGEESDSSEIVNRLLSFRPAELELGQAFALLHLYATALERAPSSAVARKDEATPQLKELAALVEAAERRVGPAGMGVSLQRGLAGLLVRLNAPGAVDYALKLLHCDRQEDRLHGLLVLRDAREGWTKAGRREYFTALNEMPRFVAGEGMPKFLAHLREDSLAELSDVERTALAELLAPAASTPPDELPASSRPLVKKWTVDDFNSSLSGGTRGDAKRGEVVFREALCVRCHRVGARGPAVGPELTFVARRFSRRDMLESILAPSKVVADNYRSVQVTTKDGRAILGRVLVEGDFRSETLRISADPLRPADVVEINKRDLEDYRPSDISPMPQGLLDGFEANDVLDLLAYLESGSPR